MRRKRGTKLQARRPWVQSLTRAMDFSMDLSFHLHYGSGRLKVTDWQADPTAICKQTVYKMWES
jgi:hypothetical protein